MAASSRLLFACVLTLGIYRPTLAQNYMIGADVSLLGKCEQDRMIFKEAGQPRDLLEMLREHHYNWVREPLIRS